MASYFRIGKEQSSGDFRPHAKRGVGVAVSAALAASLCGVAPSAALASDEDVVAKWIEATSAETDNPVYQPYSYATSEAASVDAETASALPVKYDLRDPNSDGDRSDSVVTSVKLQNPWGTCWGFAIVAASEISILSDLGKTAAETGLDLSELQVAGSVFRNGGAPERFVGASQAGEGYHNSSKNPNAGLDAGGFQTYGSSIFAAGIGPVLEDKAPYRNAEGLKWCLVGSGLDSTTEDLTDSQIAEKRSLGILVTELYWTGNYSEDGSTMKYTDWSVSEDIWNESLYEFESGNILPSMCSYDEQGNSHWGDSRAIEAAKTEIHDFGRGISVSCNVDAGLNYSTWSVYSDSPVANDHDVTIVGWDDSYAKENFVNSEGKMPEGDGAWLVKNSWGSETEDFPNGQGDYPWGIVEDGKHTGYFWLSYYDESITRMESFDFDVNSYGTNDEYYIDQYDYMPEVVSYTTSFDTPVSSANIFTAEGDMALRTLGSATYKPNSTVTYQVYLLDDEATSPTDPGHSTLVYSLDDTYRYGGYHRVTLPESDWIAMREGQRYAVVTTQKCNDDGKYYQGAASNTRQPSEAQVEKYRQAQREYYEQQCYNSTYFAAHTKYIAEGMSDEEAILKAIADAKQAVKDQAADIEKKAENDVDSYANRYFVARVNAGESWVGETVEATGDSAGDDKVKIEWTDWSVVAKDLEEKFSTMVDNVSVKAFSEIRSFASVDELASLDEALAQAKAVLAATQVSADGSDVYACDTWMTQAEHDAAAAAVEAAEKAIAAAGDYRNELANTTPSSDEVAAAENALVLEAKQGEKAVPTFPDVDYSEGSWYAEGASWCAAHGLIVGYPDGRFGVGDTVQRAQLATILWRHYEPEAAAGYDEAMPTTKGTDAVDGVEDAQYYTAAANWAVASGVIDGFEREGSVKRDFAPYGEVSFEQLVSIVAKASGADYESSDLSVLDRFADKDAVSGWAAHAMAWAVSEGLVSGWDNGADNLRELKPAEPVARERAAVVLANAFRSGVLDQPIR